MIYAISDLHLSTRGDKPMNVFGSQWDNYVDKIKEDWIAKVKDGDTVLLCGDLSWAMTIPEAMEDLKEFDSLKGTKIIIRGNHDYWWQGISKVKAALPPTFKAIQNDSLLVEDYVVCGTRLWDFPEENDAENVKIFEREKLRLRLTLDDAVRRYPDKKMIVMTHYPPFNNFKSSDFTEIIKEYNVYKVVYGHVHGFQSPHKKEVVIDDIPYILTSCDLTKFTLTLL
ncbi:MAG: metallophosphoesterase [Clostridia bacterium]|nr:metallophosphoesterase [Clostridia bacterium]